MSPRLPARALTLTVVALQLSCQESAVRQVRPDVFHLSTEIAVVNMVPFSQSDEVSQDSEPNLAVNPNDPREMVGTAFTPDPMEDRAATIVARAISVGDTGETNGIPPPPPGETFSAPVYVSTDGGDNWRLESILPNANPISGTRDITVGFGPGSGDLYAGTLRGDRTFKELCTRDSDDIFAKLTCNIFEGPTMEVRRTSDIESGQTMELLHTRGFVDQPYLEMGAAGASDRVFVGFNDLNFFVGPPDKTCSACDVSEDGPQDASGRTASVAHSLRPEGLASFSRSVVEPDATTGQNGPAVRTAAHPDGTVYAIYYHWTTRNQETGHITSDVVVVRDDSSGSGDDPFRDLIDPSRGTIGSRVVVIRRVPWANFSQPDFGQERLVNSDLSIAVDPRDSSTVYVAWADVPFGAPVADYTLHVRRSEDSGSTWSPSDLLTIVGAKNPALAISSTGKVGFLYQELARVDSSQRWVTHFRRSGNGTTWDDLVLADVPADEPEVGLFVPYIGDYVHVTAVGDDFYGVFSASNKPDLDHFPQGVRYQRRANFGSNELLSRTLGDFEPVPISIDPFFFRVVVSSPVATEQLLVD